MFECKKCGCTDSEMITKGPHLGLYCSACGAWDSWIKHTINTKTKEEYKDEYMDKEPASNSQVIYIRNLLKNKISKFKACKIIDLLGGEVDGESTL